MGMLAEFREFAMKGNVVDMAVGVIIGASFGKIVSTLVEKIFMPVMGVMTGSLGDLSKLSKTVEVPGVATGIEIGYGAFISAIIDFVIIAFCLFLVIKAMNTAKRRFEKQQVAQPAEAPADVKLLTENRDLLKARS
jgi:large conductance mechanosensitive channel